MKTFSIIVLFISLVNASLIKGKITTKDGEALGNANIVSLPSGKGAQSDDSGMFSLLISPLGQSYCRQSYRLCCRYNSDIRYTRRYYNFIGRKKHFNGLLESRVQKMGKKSIFFEKKNWLRILILITLPLGVLLILAMPYSQIFLFP